MSESAPKYILLKVSDRSAFLIGQLLEETESEVVVFFPVVMTMAVDDDDNIGVNASKWFPFAVDDIVQIPKETIIAVAAPKQNIVEHYKKFLSEMVELTDDTLENKVLANSAHRPEASSEWLPSLSVH